MELVYINLNTYNVPVTDEDGFSLNIPPSKAVEGDHFRQYADRGLLTPFQKAFVQPQSIINSQKVAAPAFTPVMAPAGSGAIAGGSVTETEEEKTQKHLDQAADSTSNKDKTPAADATPKKRGRKAKNAADTSTDTSTEATTE